MRRKQRVRVHLLDEQGQSRLPSFEGVLVSKPGWGRHEYMIGVPVMLAHPQANPDELDSRTAVFHERRVMFYEVL